MSRILIVDDNATNRRILVDMLTNWGMKPTPASSAREALEILDDRHATDVPFRLVISDVNMPRMDGFECGQCLACSAPDWILAQMPDWCMVNVSVTLLRGGEA